MYPDATQISRFRSDYVRDGTHQEVGFVDLQDMRAAAAAQDSSPRYGSVPLLRREEAETQPQRGQVPDSAQRRRRGCFLRVQPAVDLGVHSAIGIRSGFRKVMGRRGSRRRRAAQVGVTVAGGILIVKAIL